MVYTKYFSIAWVNASPSLAESGPPPMTLTEPASAKHRKWLKLIENNCINLYWSIDK